MIIGLGNTASYMDSDSEVSDGMSDRYQNQLPYRLHLGHRQVALWAFVVGQDGEVSVENQVGVWEMGIHGVTGR